MERERERERERGEIDIAIEHLPGDKISLANISFSTKTPSLPMHLIQHVFINRTEKNHYTLKILDKPINS